MVINIIKKLKLPLFAAVLSITTHQAYAGGVALGATRVIYPAGNKQVSLPINNSDERTVFLIQSWVSDEKGNKSTDFIVTPPLFTLKAQKENTMRIMYVGQGNLPGDRETVYYFNSKAIPAVPESATKGNTLQIATQSVIKLFVRPKDLPVSSADAPSMLRCKLSGSELVITNPSPYYVSMVNVYVGSKKLEHTMVAPKSEKRAQSGGGTGAVKFQTVNDYGATTRQQVCTGA
ncbi:fimbria/pilus periplasmic chaperone [Enterobacter mori]|uniref:fimbria/pilus periplasmic chaperone n=1 Tax=Enterobacter mori TaxID=539813 RepID=UPI003B83AED5